MRLANGLHLFEATNSPGTWNVAAFHSPHSVTWRWLLHFSWRTPNCKAPWPLVSWHRGHGVQVTVRIPYLATFDFHTQQPLWYRDLYYQEVDRRQPTGGER